MAKVKGGKTFSGAALSCQDKLSGEKVIYGVSRIPGMARVQLYRQVGPTIKPVAGFADEADAAQFCDWLTKVAKAASRE